MIHVLIVGEGANEIGGYDGWVTKGDTRSPGVIEAFLEKVSPGGYAIRGGFAWKDVRKLRANTRQGDEHTVRAFALAAEEHGCNALVFLRDRDDQPSRITKIETAVRQCEKRPPVRIAGGVPILRLEAWLLALRAETGSEEDPNPMAALEARHAVPAKDTAAMVALVRNAKLRRLPSDAVSLRKWLRRTFVALNVKAPDWLSP